MARSGTGGSRSRAAARHAACSSRRPGPRRAPVPLRAFFLRIAARRGQHVAAVATARKIAVVVWHMLRDGKDYIWARPALHARKLRDLELRAGHPARRGQRGAAHAYDHSATREAERRQAAGGEAAYERLT